MQVKNFEAFRRSLPDGAQLIVSKNTLLGLAADRVPGWSDLKRDIKLENAWVFANEEAMAGSIKAFLTFESKLLEPIPKAERAGVKLTEITGASLSFLNQPFLTTPFTASTVLGKCALKAFCIEMCSVLAHNVHLTNLAGVLCASGAAC